MPSVGGREQRVVAALLVASATASGAATGMAAWLIAAVIAALAGTGSIDADLVAGSPVAGLVAVAVALDLVNAVAGRPRPLARHRQVPREWGRLLAPSVVAVLYGARLGVGPLTMLSTWLWWAATIGSASLGPGPAIATGATFGFVRLAVTVGVSLMAGGPRHVERHRELRRRRRPSRIVLLGLAIGSLAVVGLTGCGADRQDQARPSTSTPTTPPDTATPITRPVALEDVVRTATTTPTDLDPTPEPEVLSLVASAEPEALAAALPSELVGFLAIDQPGADRHLDLAAAADLQPDPTEETALLETRGFQGGWTRAFRSLGNDVAVTSVYQFDDAAAAEFYLEDGLITIGGYGGAFFDIEGQPGVRGFVQELDDDGEQLRSLGAAFQTGPRWYLIYLVGSPETVTADVLVPMVSAQRAIAAETETP